MRVYLSRLQSFRNQFFKLTGEYRWKRILVIALGLAIYWCFIEWLTIGELKPNYWHDIICLAIAVIVERSLPWGKKEINMEKYMIAIKDSSSNSYYEIGHCFRCVIEDDKVTLENEMCWCTETISTVQLNDDFIEMSKKDFDLYMALCEDGEDPTEAVLNKYL
ncbi:hypothetical protein LAV72_18385 [Lysinibacillus xylanilyticus]|uniref:hypothetical protein n=1 Tax=Lysinibacillus xylanilyticus TaxID=582475 RepID=UPI002B246480|nr:hypothetical protein [Lysinibacillus xylanilyticus]MEB2301575.1 hypothetical protein [Lysinibacillus xylanilyticus]